MSRRKKQKEQDETLIDIVEVGEQAQSFLEKYQTLIIGGVAGLLLLVGGYFAYKTFVQAPKQKEAISQMAQAQVQFARDSFASALENPGAGFPGFLEIIDKYSGTPSANSAKYYAGISYLNLGRFEDAISYLNQYSANDDITSIMKFGALGDAYSEMNDMTKALSMYQKAANAAENDFLVPLYLQKFAMLSNIQGNKADARAAYERIKKDYPTSDQGRDADKYLALFGE